MMEVPLGFSNRLHRRLEDNMRGNRRSFLGWMAAAAAAVITVGAVEVASSASHRPEPRSEHAQPGVGVPPGMMVVVSDRGKIFHVPTCTFIHDRTNLRTIAAREAMQEGYVPCVRCMKEYLKS
jgi:hypothetical protein